MATYLGNVQDSIEQYQPYKPNLQFDAQILQTKQSQYDSNHEKLNNLYTSALNARMTRADNIQGRDEFFKTIDSDIKRMTRMDLSKASNVTSAANVFSAIYENDSIVKDMNWTKNYEDEVSRAEMFKSCVDPEKCGGTYWEKGEQYLHMKRQEFAEANQSDAMQFENVAYVPYSNVMAKAIKVAKDAGLSITRDTIEGNYKVTTKNGEALISPLANLFDDMFSQDPGLQKQFEVEAYIDRKNWIAEKHASGAYATKEEAEAGYVVENSNAINDRLESIGIDVGADHERLENEYNNLIQDANDGEILEGSKEHKRLEYLQKVMPSVKNAVNYIETAKSAVKNTYNSKNLRQIGNQLDMANGAVILHRQLEDAAKTLAYKDSEVTVEADEFAKLNVEHSHAMALENLKASNKLKEEAWKLEHGHSSYQDKNATGKPGEGLMSAADEVSKIWTKTQKENTKGDLTDYVAQKLMDEGIKDYSKEDIAKLGAMDDTYTDSQVKAINMSSAHAKRAQYWTNMFKAQVLDNAAKANGLEGGYQRRVYQEAVAKKGQTLSGSTSPKVTKKASYTAHNPIAKKALESDLSTILPMDVDDVVIKTVAENHPDKEVRQKYKELQNTPVSKLPEPVKRQIAIRFNQMAVTSNEITEDKVLDSGVTVVSNAYRNVTLMNNHTKSEVNKSVYRMNNAYLTQLDVKSNEYKQLEKNVAGFLTKYSKGSYGKASGSGELRYGKGEDVVGYKTNADGKSYQYGSGFKANLNPELVKKLIRQNPLLGKYVYKTHVANANFKSDYVADGSYAKDKKHFERYDKLQKAGDKGLANKHADIMNKVMESVSNELDGDDARYVSNLLDDAIVNGKLVQPRGMNNELFKVVKNSYRDALNKVYSSKEGDGKEVSGGMFVKDYLVKFPDLKSTEPQSAGYLIQQHLSEAEKMDIGKGTGYFAKVSASNNEVPINDNAKARAVIQDILSGKEKVVSVVYNSAAGSHPNKALGRNKSYSKATVTLDNGEEYVIGLDNQEHSTLIRKELNTSDEYKIINTYGSLEAYDGSVHTNNKPIKLVKSSDSRVKAVGSVKLWDNNAGKLIDYNVEDVINTYYPDVSTPAEMLIIVDNLVNESKKDLKTYNNK